MPYRLLNVQVLYEDDSRHVVKGSPTDGETGMWMFCQRAGYRLCVSVDVEPANLATRSHQSEDAPVRNPEYSFIQCLFSRLKRTCLSTLFHPGIGSPLL